MTRSSPASLLALLAISGPGCSDPERVDPPTADVDGGFVFLDVGTTAAEGGALDAGPSALLDASDISGLDATREADAPAGGFTDARPSPDAAEQADSGPARGQLRVTVKLSGTATAGVHVLFSDARGAIRGHERTDLLGVAEHEVDTGDSVTVLSQGAGVRSLFTVARVVPGDRVEIELGRPSALPITTARIVLPGSYPGASYYNISATCAGTAVNDPPTNVPPLAITEACLGPRRTFDLLARAVDASSHVLAYALTHDVSPRGPSTEVTLGPWRTDFQAVFVDATNLPSGAVSSAGLSLDIDGALLPSDSIGGPFPQVLRVPPQPGLSVAATLILSFSGPRAGGGTMPLGFERILSRSPRAGNLTLDAAALLPHATDLALDRGAPRPTLRFVLSRPALGADLISTQASWDSGYDWRAALPPDATELALPTLPIDLAAWEPPSAAPSTITVFVVDRDQIHGWDEARQTPVETVSRAYSLAPGETTNRVSQGLMFQ